MTLNYKNACALFNGRAVFSDETDRYLFKDGDRRPYARIRTLADDADAVCLCVLYTKKRNEPIHVAALRPEGEEADLQPLEGFPDGTYKAFPMVNDMCESGFDYYKAPLPSDEGPVQYFFRLRRDDRYYYYSRLGLGPESGMVWPFRYDPGYYVPSWARGIVLYQIFTDRFCNGDTRNDTLTGEYSYLGRRSIRVDDWYSVPETFDVHRFYGGDLQGVIDKLDYLKDLGVEGIYFNPLFLSPSNHKYDTRDYDHIDPHFGRFVTDEGALLPEGDEDNRHAERYLCRTMREENLTAGDMLFAKLVEEAHSRGMKIILDAVFNHCGSFHRWFDREKLYGNGAYEDENSPYHSFFHFNPESSWPDNDKADYWWGNETLPKLAYEQSPELENEIFRIAKKWMSPPFNIDGWRLDVAADLGPDPEYNREFWKRFRQEVRSVNPEVLILAEHYGSAAPYLAGDMWDTVMNYDGFMDPVSYFLTGMEKHSDTYRGDLQGDGTAFRDAMRVASAQFSAASLQASMLELSNHDHSRFMTRTTGKVGRVAQLGSAAAGTGVRPYLMREAIVLQMTLSGAPTIYYGDEAGQVGFTDPDSRRTYPWGAEDKDLLTFYKEMIRIHREHEALRTGSVKDLACGTGFISFGRFTKDEQIVCAVNVNRTETEVTLPVWELGISRSGKYCMERLAMTDRRGYDFSPAYEPLNNGMLTLRLQGREAAVFIATHKEHKPLIYLQSVRRSKW